MKSLSRVWLFATPWTVACTRFLCPWDFLSKSTGVGCHCFLQGIFLTQGSNPGLLHCRQMLSNTDFFCMNIHSSRFCSVSLIHVSALSPVLHRLNYCRFVLSISYKKSNGLDMKPLIEFWKKMRWSQQTPSSNNTREDSTHGHHQMVNTKIRLIMFFAAKDGEALYSQ